MDTKFFKDDLQISLTVADLSKAPRIHFSKSKVPRKTVISKNLHSAEKENMSSDGAVKVYLKDGARLFLA